MGPPKMKQRKVPVGEMRKRYDTFEYRWDANSNSFYLYCPYTGETISSANVELINRKVSMWAPPEKYPSTLAQTIELLPEWYLSRRWGRRRFYGWASEEAAATHINAVARGFLARLYLRRYYRERYYKMLDKTSGYYYFVDSYYPERESVWFKPLLAFPDDILSPKEENPLDYLKGKKYSKSSFDNGPFLRVCGLSKFDVGRADLDAFLVPNPIRDAALKRYEDVDLEMIPLNEIVAWMDGDKLSSLWINEFHYIRAAICHNNWEAVYNIMQEHPTNIQIQIYGFHSFSKTDVPMDHSGFIDYITAKVMMFCAEVIADKEKQNHRLVVLSAMKAFHNIMSVRAARAEYLSLEKVKEQGPGRDAAIEEFYRKRIGLFSQYLSMIETETYQVYNKGEKVPHEETKPLARSVELVEGALRCLCLISQERESKESLAFMILDPLLFALEVCEDEAYVIYHGLQLLYNLCYRCEPGQQAILVVLNTEKFFQRINYHHSGDADVTRQCRRLELALAKDGWRGNVEQIITAEMYSEQKRVRLMENPYYEEEEAEGRTQYHSSSEYKE